MKSNENSPPGYLLGATLCGRYFLRKFAGSGGTAEVYLAWDQIRATNVAIKVLHPQIDKTSLHLFKKEAELLRKLEHPFIVRRYDLECHEELIFLVMDWIEGKDLRKYISSICRPLSLDQVSKILIPVCSALSFMHQNGVFHCDIKPANILLHVDGRVLLTDFGVARLASEIFDGGTPAYMAPEQIQDLSVDARTDIYSLGVTLYECLSGGILPFSGDSASSQGNTKSERIKWEHCYKPTPPLNQFNTNLPAQIEKVIHKALSKDSQQRYASPLIFLEAFEKACSEMKSYEVVDTVVKKSQEAIPIPEKSIRAVPSSVSVASTHLFCKAGQYAGKVIPIAETQMDIGRLSGNQLCLRDPSVSRRHARIVCTRRAVYIQDEGSTVGTFVNGRRVLGPQVLNNGDVIVIGNGQIFEFRRK